MAAKAVAAKRRSRRSPRDFRAFSERVLSDPKVQAAILRQAREGKLQPQVVALLAAHFAGKPKDAPPPPSPPSTWTTEAYEHLTPRERRWMLALTRKSLGRKESGEALGPGPWKPTYSSSDLPPGEPSPADYPPRA
jgi:hypothetical protein